MLRRRFDAAPHFQLPKRNEISKRKFNLQAFGFEVGSQESEEIRIFAMAGKEEVKQLEECSVSNALGTWVFSVAGALIAIPIGIKRKSLAPLVFFGTTGTMLDIIMGISACEREHAERQMKLLESQNADGSDAGIES
ncbi:GRAM domain-containing protein [Striga asiatica]|uniref:GRAM domain-containing protein n=1 Tax=Striga asiatica TaxID=4170 RepID=A0A5A7QVX6_STRAF|nr:GRAM domain-containing protein [Striga asiatica]